MVVITINRLIFMRCAWVVFPKKVFELSHELVFNSQDKELYELNWIVLVEL
jgi:hypothetical protein